MSNQDLTRRRFAKLTAGTLIAGAGTSLLPIRASRAEALNEDGLHHQPWFLESFLELEDDLNTAGEAGKHFAVMWELKGCPYCAETHNVNFAQKRITDFIKANFDVLQLNFIGSRRVTDFDGEELFEKDLARKYGIRFTPTIQFFPKSAEGLGTRKPVKREVARMPGYMKPDHFLQMFQYIAGENYQSKSFRDYLKSGQS
ncbi:MAG: thioredoxin family protein [Sneathiella sp.]